MNDDQKIEAAPAVAMPPRVGIADPRGMFCELLTIHLRDAGIAVDGVARTYKEAADLLCAQDIDILLADRVPPINGLQLARELPPESTKKIIILDSRPDDLTSVYEALRSGASSYVPQTSAVADLVTTILHVHNNQPTLPTDALQGLIRYIRNTDHPTLVIGTDYSFGMSTYAVVVISPATTHRPVVSRVSHATRPDGSSVRMASRTASEIWSAILSG